MKKRYIMILVVLLAVGFASVSTNLIINGLIGVGANESDFKVIFTKAKLNDVIRNDFIDKETKQSLTFETDKLINLNDEAILYYEVANTSRLYDGEVVINCIVPENDYINIEYEPKSMTVLSGTSKSGSITARLVRTSTEESNISIKCTLNASALERESLGEEYIRSLWKITRDNDNDGVLSKGDLITLATESFYVYDIEGDKVKAISQYNLDVGYAIDDGWWMEYALENPTGLQNPLARGLMYNEQGNSFPFIGVVRFTTLNKYNNEIAGMTENIPGRNDYNISTIKEYVDEYANKLNSLKAQVDMVRLITKEELETAGCNFEKRSCKTGYRFESNLFSNPLEDTTFLGAPEYLYSTSYWTSSPNENKYDLTSVLSNGYYGMSGNDEYRFYGVRPVIEISKSLLE